MQNENNRGNLLCKKLLEMKKLFFTLIFINKYSLVRQNTIVRNAATKASETVRIR